MFPLADANDGKIVCYTLTKDFLIYGTDVRLNKRNSMSLNLKMLFFLERNINILSC